MPPTLVSALKGLTCMSATCSAIMGVYALCSRSSVLSRAAACLMACWPSRAAGVSACREGAGKRRGQQVGWGEGGLGLQEQHCSHAWLGMQQVATK